MCDSRVQLCSQRGSAGPEFGSPPHDDRVLAVVLVMPEGVPAPDVRVVHVEPNTPHGEAFWQDAGRPWCGQAKSAEATAPDICVPNPCPTGTATAEAARAWAFVCRTSGVDPEKWESFARYRGAVLPGRARLCIDIANRLNRTSREHAREDLIERLGPLPEPIPRREP